MTTLIATVSWGRVAVLAIGLILAIGGWFAPVVMEDIAVRSMNFDRADAMKAYGWLGQLVAAAPGLLAAFWAAFQWPEA